jgi:hypothetical protein
MSTITFVTDIRGEMVTVTCNVYRDEHSQFQLMVEEEVVVEHPDWNLKKEELQEIRDLAVGFYTEGDENEENFRRDGA